MTLFRHRWIPKFFYKKFDGGKESGGTGQALRIAAHYDIPIYNLYFPEKYKEVMNL